MTAILEIAGLEAGYGQSQVLFGLDLKVGAGETASLLGRNGMGKTTTVRAIMGLTPPSGGSITFMGERIDGKAPDRIARMGLALVPEGRQIFPNLTVKENLVAFAANRAASAEPWTLDRVYAFFPRLAERAANLGGRLSGGEQQMLAIGRALMLNPSVLLLDEPSEGLAPLIVEEIVQVIRRVRDEGLAVLLIEQNLGAALAAADAFHIMTKGELCFSGTRDALQARPDLMDQHLALAH
jgi:branched-chain amino acid transport system ATP-binding protein